MPRTVLHLVGSAVSDFYADLSRLYAADCLAATTDDRLYEFVIAYVSPDLSWRFPEDLTPASIAAAPALPIAEALTHLTRMQVDVAVPQMFCLPGMTYYRGLLDALGIPYIGNPSEIMALGAHKARARAVVAAAGVPVPTGELCGPGEFPSLPPPVVVKPVDADNSWGISLVRNTDELTDALALAHENSAQAIVETYIELGREVRCGILERDGELLCLPLEEYSVTTIRGYADKLRVDDGGMSLVAKEATKAWIVDIEDPITERVWELARRSHRAMGCRDYSLFDFRIDPEGQPWFLEAGLYCSFAEKSVISMMAAAAGLPLSELFRSFVEARSREA